MSPQVWATSQDGTIEYVSLTRKYLDKSLEALREGFFKHENVCKSIKLSQEPQAVEECVELARIAALDGISLIAIEKSTDKVVGVAFNKIQVYTPEDVFFEDYKTHCKYETSKYVLNFMMQVDAKCNLFELLQTKCLAELMFVGTLPECRGKGVGLQLCKSSLDLLKKLVQKDNVKQALEEGTEVPLEPIPTAASSIFTTFITKRIGEKLGFSECARVSYEEFSFQETKLSELIEKESPFCTLEYYKL